MYPRYGRLLNSRSAFFCGKKNPAGMYPRNGRLLNSRSAFLGGNKAPAGMYPRNGKLLNSERFCRHCRSERRWGAGRHVIWCGISLRIFLDGSRGVNSFVSKSIFPTNIGPGRQFLENLENGRCSGARNGSPWLGTGSRWVEMNRTASRKPLGHLPGLWEAIKNSKTPENPEIRISGVGGMGAATKFSEIRNPEIAIVRRSLFHYRHPDARRVRREAPSGSP